MPARVVLRGAFPKRSVSLPKSQFKHSTCSFAAETARVEDEHSPEVLPTTPSALKSRSKQKRDLPGVYQRGNVWVAVVEGPRDPTTGKRRKIWLRERFASRPKAEAASRAMYAQIRAGAIAAGSAKITVAAHLARWLANIETRVAARTAASYRGIVTGRLIPSLGNVKLARLTASQISDAVTLWTSGSRNDRRTGKLSSRSVQLALVVLRMALRQAVKWGALTSNVAELVDAPRVERKTQAFVCADDLDRLFVEAEKCDMFAAVATAIGLGLRRGELLALQWADVDFERRTVAVVRARARERRADDQAA
jgi:integrase